MQLASITPAIAPATTPIRPEVAIAPGAVLGHGQFHGYDEAAKQVVEFEASVIAGPVLLAGVTDIQSAAMDLIGRGWNGEPRDHSGLVGFVRNGDAWDAVALLAPELPGKPLKQLWSVGELRGLKVGDGVQLDAIWQVSDYGHDMYWGTERSMIPRLP